MTNTNTNNSKLEIILYDKKYSLLDTYNTGEVKPKALYYAKKFNDACYHIFPFVRTENKLFNLFLRTFNCYRKDNLTTQLKNVDEVIDAVNMFDDIVTAMASKNGLNICKIYINLEKCYYDPTKYKNTKYIDWNL